MAEYRIEFLKTAEKELAKLLEKGFKLLIKYKLLLMMPFEKCPVCGGELIEKKVTKLLRGGVNIASISVPAEVCLSCGERLYSQETVRHFAALRAKLKRGETQEFHLLGQSFEIV